MSLALSNSARLRPDIRLAQAVSEFEASLTTQQKASFRIERSLALDRPPEQRDVMQFTAAVDRCVSASQNGPRVRCVGPRLTNVLETIQRYVGLVVNHSAYLEKLSLLFMNAGRSAPRYQQMALLYPRSKILQGNMCEYLIVIVQVCHRLLRFSQKSYVAQLAASLSDADIKQYQTDLERWAASIKEEVNFLMSQKIEEEARENTRFRLMTTKFSETTSHRIKVKKRLQTLDACSVFDHQTPWKQARKIGNTRLFAETSQYNEWRDGEGSTTLICTGKLGSGKSVLLANIVDDLNLYAEKGKSPVAYFFCRHDIPESLRPRTIIGSLVRQLLATTSTLVSLPDGALDGRVNHEMDLDDLLDYFRRAFEPRSQCYFVLDGLDECAESDRKTLLVHCRSLQQHLRLILCVSFRLEADNRLQLSLGQFALPVVFSIPEDNPEIVAFIHAEVQSHIAESTLNIGDLDIIQEIQDALLQGAQGMFLWVALQISSLCAERTDERIRNALKDLPQDLSETFSRILNRAAPHDRVYQRQILELVATAYRPLAAEELREALSVVPGNTDWNPAKLVNDINSTLACCGSLLTVDEEEGTIRLVHHSVKQYLIGEFHDGAVTSFELEDANRLMGRIILTYLNYNVFETQLSTTVMPEVQVGTAPRKVIESIGGSSTTRSVALMFLKPWTRSDSRVNPSHDMGQFLASQRGAFRNRGTVEAHAFILYAKTYWPFHTTSISPSDVFSYKALLRLLDQASSDPSSPPPWDREDLDSPRYPASVEDPEPFSLETRLTITVSPVLYWALKNSHLPLLRDQMRTKSAIKTVAGIYLAIKKLLFSPDPPNWHPDMCTQLLPFAALHSSTHMVRFLLDRGASVSSRSHCVISTAISRGSLTVLRLLLASLDDSDEIKSYLNSLEIDPVLEASRRKNAELVSFLVSQGAAVDRPHSISPLYYILVPKDKSPAFLGAAEVLVDAGAKLRCPNEKGIVHDILLDMVLSSHFCDLVRPIMRSLTKDDLDQLLYSCCCKFYDLFTLDKKQSQACLDLASLALELGANPEARGNTVTDERNCLTAVCHDPHPERNPLLKLLLESGASPLMKNDARHRNNLEYCLLSKQSALIGIFELYGLKRGQVLQSIKDLGLLHRRIEENDHDEIKFLCSFGDAYLNTPDPRRLPMMQTALLTAIACKGPKADPAVLVLDIVSRGANLDYKRTGYPSPLEAVIDRVTYGEDSSCFHEHSASFLRVARSLVAFGAHFEEDLLMRVLKLSMAPFLQNQPVELDSNPIPVPPLMPSEVGQVAHKRRKTFLEDGSDSPDDVIRSSHKVTVEGVSDTTRRKNLHQSNPEDSVLSLLEQLLREMVARKPPSTALQKELIYMLGECIPAKLDELTDTLHGTGPVTTIPNSHLFIGHTITILSLFLNLPPPVLPSNPLEQPTSRKDSFARNGLGDLEDPILEFLSLHILPLGEQPRGDIGILGHSVLKYGRPIHDALVKCSSSMSHIDWATFIESSIDIAVSEGDTESVLAGWRLQTRSGIAPDLEKVEQAEQMWQRLNALPEEGIYYELEATTPYASRVELGTVLYDGPDFDNKIFDMIPTKEPLELPIIQPLVHPSDANVGNEHATYNTVEAFHKRAAAMEKMRKRKSRWWLPEF
ncbi:hypothetical protein FZEAL_7652 [Fusarium zealandicum]|uniref:NACHT domain-containing protein n=1 Tax=Fusarium zealandicum TaxID=1053134 RepID=A0A8H4UFC4_9HYPO|nr:hypothetical protein FZEAL_7652 [Fusarium zealandicum]